MSQRLAAIGANASSATSRDGASRSWWDAWVTAWDRFWFTPTRPHVLSLIRIATGLMLLYSQGVLALRLDDFLGKSAWIDDATIAALHGGEFGTPSASRSYLWRIESPGILRLHHAVTMFVSGCFAVGFLTRVMAPLAWFLQLMLLHRLTGVLFGLDQITTMLAMYLMIAPCGAAFSVDAWLRKRFVGGADRGGWLGWLFPDDSPSVMAGVATRLAQIHLCVIYLFGGLWKARGTTWWDGTALWFAASNYEYQSNDLTWLGRYPVIFSALTHATLFWEVFYCGLVWSRLTRRIALVLAVAAHAGIAIFLGMVTFGVMMIVANGVFIDPDRVRKFFLRAGRSSADQAT